MPFRWVVSRRSILLGLAATLVILAYVGLAMRTGQAGFPLDDAWIHQTYARNLVETGRWEYTPGVVSAGSTAPLWTLLLAVGYLLHVPHLFWAYLLGGITLFGLALASMRIGSQLGSRRVKDSWGVGFAVIFAWPLVWAAGSGMETILFSTISLWTIALYLSLISNGKPAASTERARRHEVGGRSVSVKPMIALGLLSGLLVLTRPDGLVLLLLVIIGLSLERSTLSKRVVTLAIYVTSIAVVLVPYLAFNLRVSGNFWPNTFYAKQAEYAVLLAQPLASRFARLLIFNLGGPEAGWRGSSGAHLFLLPGLIASSWLALKKDWTKRHLCRLLPLLWAVGHVALYSWRLPVTYHHGRYLMVTIPVWIVYGIEGWRWIISSIRNGRAERLARRVAILSFALLSLLFWILGAQAYATDVAFIDGEMVNVAHWLNGNTPSDALIASHDIGAIGYFAKRPLLDLAGLITPDIIPLLTDEAALSQYILASDADYLVTAPGWTYAGAVAADTTIPIYTTGYQWTLDQGVNNMSVYQLIAPSAIRNMNMGAICACW